MFSQGDTVCGTHSGPKKGTNQQKTKRMYQFLFYVVQLILTLTIQLIQHFGNTVHIDIVATLREPFGHYIQWEQNICV